jgi:hypothetical protein
MFLSSNTTFYALRSYHDICYTPNVYRQETQGIDSSAFDSQSHLCVYVCACVTQNVGIMGDLMPPHSHVTI